MKRRVIVIGGVVVAAIVIVLGALKTAQLPSKLNHHILRIRS